VPALIRLNAAHDLTEFDSGEPSLDTWLRNSALVTARRGLSVTYVWTEADVRVIGYATLAAGSIAKEELSKSTGHGYPNEIPVIRMARLALDKSLQGQHLGGALLAEALGIAVRGAADIGAAFIVVDALNERAAEFYKHYKFIPVPNSLRLVRKVSEIAAAVSLEE
jgi:ribosomal protein S18 acetylase RimI-like enzyme